MIYVAADLIGRGIKHVVESQYETHLFVHTPSVELWYYNNIQQYNNHHSVIGRELHCPNVLL